MIHLSTGGLQRERERQRERQRETEREGVGGREKECVYVF